MNRRRFVVTGISAGAVGAALATACSTRGGFVGLPPTDGDEPVPAVQDAAGVYTLTTQYANVIKAGYKMRLRTYDGATAGPLLVTRPGAMLRMKIVNKLPPNPKTAPSLGRTRIPRVTNSMEAMDPDFRPATTVPSGPIDPMNNPHDFNTTNLHVHGIQTLPHLFKPIGTSNPTADMIGIEPGQSFLYNFPVPPDHPSGLHWYHPHHHGATDIQVSGGCAGLIVVRGPVDDVPQIKAAREIFLVVQTLEVNASKTKPGWYDREYISYRTPQNGGYGFRASYTMLTTNGKPCYWIENRANPQKYTDLGEQPSYNVAPGEVVRIRLLNGTNYMPLMLALPEFETWQIGFDGVNTLRPIKNDMTAKGLAQVTAENFLDAPVRFAFSGNRIELLIRAPQTAGTYNLSSFSQTGLFETMPTLTLAKFVVSGKPVSMGIPATLPKPTREYPVIKNTDVVARREFLFEQGSNSALLTGFGFTINGQLYQEMQCPFAPQVGTCEEWYIENDTEDAHPFHLHTNSFQLININGKPNVPMEIWDTFVIPPKIGNVRGNITIRVRFLQWYGKDVFHCHILPHEDTGMMMNFLMA